ncbi:MAGUK p55 subfamily member 4 [Latimeria chalumnae]|uniref:MAGUK p55 subfamily member 4 n=1 Tax=Latimeria chalumnae TaxID=7897 RepID=UPI00313EF73C
MDLYSALEILCVVSTGVSHILTSVIEELSLMFDSKINGVGVLYKLLNTRWLQSLVKVYECLHQFVRRQPVPITPQATAVLREVTEVLREAPQSADVKELKRLLRSPHFKAFLTAHDVVAQKDFDPVLPPLPDHIPENEEAMRIVCLVKNKQPLGATIKRDELTRDIVVARVIHGGLADRSGLLHTGDKLVEVNGVQVEGLEPEQVIHILAQSQGTIMFKLIPISERQVHSQTTLYVRAMADYCPLQDPAIPCADAGMAFRKGEILQIVDQNDALWWQARKLSELSVCAGLVPSNHLLKRKQREFWWSQPFQPHLCMKNTIFCYISQEILFLFCVFTDALGFIIEEEVYGYNERFYIAGFRRSMRLCRRKSLSNQLSCYSRCPSSCYSSVASPYEEVVRYQRHPDDRHRLIVLVGPSGIGVNELRQRLIGINPNQYRGAVPHTTRPQKNYEEEGREYHFVTRETFESMVCSYRFLEYGEYKDHLYGTSIDAVRTVLDEGRICIIDLEPQAIQGARTHELKPYVIFIKPPSISCLMSTRKHARIITEYYVNLPFKEEDFQEMEETAKKIESQFGQFFDNVIENGSLQDTCVQLLSSVRRAQDEPQWVPANWLCPDSQS